MEITFSFPDGRAYPISDAPVRLELSRDGDTPADGLELRYASAGPICEEEPCGIRVTEKGRLIFEGIVDTHTVDAEQGSRMEHFLCRSKAAKLLDNEAQPGVLNMPSLRLMEKLYLAPFGLRAGSGVSAPIAGRLPVEQKTRCWAVLRQFAEQFLKTEIYCTRDGAVCFSARSGKKLDLPTALRLRISKNPYGRISRVVVQNARTGAYNAVYENAQAAGVQRVRYLSARAQTAPQALLSAGEREALEVAVTFAGYVDADPGDWADLTAYDPTLPVMQVATVRFVQTAETAETTLTLLNPLYGKENGYVEF